MGSLQPGFFRRPTSRKSIPCLVCLLPSTPGVTGGTLIREADRSGREICRDSEGWCNGTDDIRLAGQGEEGSAVPKSLLDFIKGNFTKRFVTHFYSLLIVGTISIFYMAAVICYKGYALPYDDISYLGDSQLNSNGWFFWNIGTALTGLLLVPLQPYFFRRLRRFHSVLGTIAVLLLSMSAIGMIGVGAIPETDNSQILHELNAGLAFSGLYFGILFAVIVLVRYGRLRLRHSLLLVISWLSGPVGFMFTQALHTSSIHLLVNVSYGTEGYPWYLRFSMWEWMLFFSIFISLIIFMRILPDLNEIP
jgi:hypothetical protein